MSSTYGLLPSLMDQPGFVQEVEDAAQACDFDRLLEQLTLIFNANRMDALAGVRYSLRFSRQVEKWYAKKVALLENLDALIQEVDQCSAI